MEHYSYIFVAIANWMLLNISRQWLIFLQEIGWYFRSIILFQFWRGLLKALFLHCIWLIILFTYYYFRNHLRVSCRHVPSPLNPSVCIENTLMYDLSLAIKIKMFTLMQHCYPVHRPFSNFSDCPSDILYRHPFLSGPGSSTWQEVC